VTRLGMVQIKVFTEKELEINWVECVIMNVVRFG
jgi:hypothetical protein